MSEPSLKARVATLERAMGAVLGIDISEFDPVAVQDKRVAEAKAAKEKAAEAEAAEQARADAIREAQKS